MTAVLARCIFCGVPTLRGLTCYKCSKTGDCGGE